MLALSGSPPEYTMPYGLAANTPGAESDTLAKIAAATKDLIDLFFIFFPFCVDLIAFLFYIMVMFLSRDWLIFFNECYIILCTITIIIKSEKLMS